MKIILIVIGVMALILIIKAFMPAQQKSENAPLKPSTIKKPSQLNPNDKIVIVANVTYNDLKGAVVGFCNMYNEDNVAVVPRLVKISEKSFAITFPFDIDFERYCYFVNYLKYPVEIHYNPDVTAWTSTKQVDAWITEKSANKKAMLFIPEDDNEYDNVFLTTEDNIGYKLGFAVGKEKQLLESPKRSYLAPTIDLHALAEMQSEDFY